jgi:hypothetical protein
MTYQIDLMQSSGGKSLAVVRFEQETPEADAAMVDVVFEVHTPDDYGVIGRNRSARVLIFLSATRTDTRKPWTMSEEERNTVFSAVAEKLLELMQEWEDCGTPEP